MIIRPSYFIMNNIKWFGIEIIRDDNGEPFVSHKYYDSAKYCTNKRQTLFNFIKFNGKLIREWINE